MDHVRQEMQLHDRKLFTPLITTPLSSIISSNNFISSLHFNNRYIF
ncbi:6576_t:CDS:2 [Funneliformis caledonium]|uniref:6576_t:CDS:1 n=1 Tax=Funneliformis caledonium TaxID=1117310 RepID=A0A9N9ACD0_9GLOM|nr:6576_t:CDS:2 [Funneliformis caledonium]